MNSTRAAGIAVFAGWMAWSLLAATASNRALAQSRGAADGSSQRDPRDRDDQGRNYNDNRQQDYDDSRGPALQGQPAPQQGQTRAPADDRSGPKLLGPQVRPTNSTKTRPRDTQEWRTRQAPNGPRSNDRHVDAPRPAQPTGPQGDVRQAQYQTDPRNAPASAPREQPYDWHPGRDQAPRARQTGLSEAPRFDPNAPAPVASAPVDRRASAPPPEYRGQDNQAPVYRPPYRNEPDRMAGGDRRPPNQRGGEPMFFAQQPQQQPRQRGPYRPTSTANTYELPPGSAPFQAQPEIVQGSPSPGGNYSGGQPIYSGQPTYGGSSGPFDVDGNGYPVDGYGYGDGGGGGPDGYGQGGYGQDSECYYNCCGPCQYCSTCCGGPSCPHRWFEEANVFVGVHSFQGGLDKGQNGNFGFQEGASTAGSLWHQYGIGYQVGGMFAQSDLAGSNVNGTPNLPSVLNSSRQQTFITAGLFRRAMFGHGFQGGAVFDWLDDRYYSDSQFAQIRAEASYLWGNGHEAGFWGAFNTGQSQLQVISTSSSNYSSTNLYSFFYRKTVANGGQARVWGGFTDNKGGLFGADFRIPMTNRWDFVGGFNYLIPQNGASTDGFQQESWGMSLNIVWYPTRRDCGTHNGPFRQLFTVADNNVFMIRKK